METTWKLSEDSRPKTERKKSSWQGTRPEEKEQWKCFVEEFVDTPFASDINTVTEKRLIRNYICGCCCQWMMKYH